MAIRIPPSAPLNRQNEYLLPHDSRWSRFKLMIARFFMRRMGVSHDATDMMRSAMKLGNPTKAEWPTETLPMNSRIFASGFWNYSFFQFNRKFLPPFWAVEQYNPKSVSFLPRSHNILALNQTQRNWIAIGFPGRSNESSIDMVGSIMVSPGSYTIEFATLEKGRLVRPADEAKDVKLTLLSSYRLRCEWRGITVEYTATETGIHLKGFGSMPLILSVRPFNFEGPALLYKLHYQEKRQHLTGDADIFFTSSPNAAFVSNWKKGDALRRISSLLKHGDDGAIDATLYHEARETIGLTSASFYFASANQCGAHIENAENDPVPAALSGKNAKAITSEFFSPLLKTSLPKDFSAWLEHAQMHLMTLWDYDSIKPGSYTYHHFWIRDAVIMMYALLVAGAHKAVKPIIERFTTMVRSSGLFESQTGEWDANGQALWIVAEYTRFTNDSSLVESMQKQIAQMVAWFERTCAQNGGILPPGFSAEHLGPADWYLWDNFWALGGLKAIAPLAPTSELRERIQNISQYLSNSLVEYLKEYTYLPAALGRNKDAGMIGSISALYPLQIAEFCDERMLRTLDLIRSEYFFRGCFFQDNIHSGMNPYLTLQMAECYLATGQTREARNVLRSVKKKAHKAYTFPEAIHVHSGGGCMGDGFHGWASAESILMIRNLIAREQTLASGETALIWLSGFSENWLNQKSSAQNIATPWGKFAYGVADGILMLHHLSASVRHILSLPYGFRLHDKKTGREILPLSIDALFSFDSGERSYFSIENVLPEMQFTFTAID